jgi:molybdate transport system substrate-binding protein
MFKIVLRVASIILLALSANVHAEEQVRVFAAASLTNVFTDISVQWQKAGHPLPSISFGASSALAKQVDSGAPADLFASADLKWMDFLDEHRRIEAGGRVNLLGNSLVLIVPKGHPVTVRMQPGFDFAGAFKGKLCTGEPGVVPVGIYAKQSLENLGWWQAIQQRIVGTDDVRTALAFVERGECPLGIVYATDAGMSDKVDVVATFPESSHAPIVYPVGLVKGGRTEAKAFVDYLVHSPEAATMYEHYGFTRLAK